MNWKLDRFDKVLITLATANLILVWLNYPHLVIWINLIAGLMPLGIVIGRKLGDMIL